MRRRDFFGSGVMIGASTLCLPGTLTAQQHSGEDPTAVPPKDSIPESRALSCSRITAIRFAAGSRG